MTTMRTPPASGLPRQRPDGGAAAEPDPADTETPAPTDTETPAPTDTETPAPADAETPAPADAAAGDTTPSREERSPINLREIAAYTSTFFGLACLVKVYGVSRFSTTTTAALITTAPEQVVLGTLAIYVYPTMAILAYGTPWLSMMWRESVPRQTWPLVISVTVLAALMTPPEYHLACLAILAASVLVEVALRRLPPCRRPGLLRDVSRAAYGRSFAFLGGTALLAGFIATLESPWASAEVFVVTEPVVTATQDLDDGAEGTVDWATSGQPFVGYVVDESLTEYRVLNASTRYIMLLEKSQVTARYSCHSTQGQLRGHQPLLDVLRGRRYLSPHSDCNRLVAALTRGDGPSGT
jgi:hypothetical protein